MAWRFRQGGPLGGQGPPAPAACRLIPTLVLASSGSTGSMLRRLAPHDLSRRQRHPVKRE
ncbi:hypothetical protein BEI_2562 [Halomonas beimenensis]|uniref:Uncharacterized protein n=1 Tax=Halomonas beimenensis TaxID=475662 RepID=A0A291P9K2_9GAMM|nr:hypothetical protein BEI_2562 [Halomonas beimenensis]